MAAGAGGNFPGFWQPSCHSEFYGLSAASGQHFNFADSGACGIFSSAERHGADLFRGDFRPELYGLSLPALAVGGGLLLLVALLYFGLAPQGALAFLLTPLALVLHVPLAVPVAFGLLETPLSAIGIAAGTVSYYGLKSVIGTEFVLSDPSLSMQEAFIEEMQAMLSNFLGNGEMILTLIALTAVLIAAFAVRSMEMRYAWPVAIGTGIFIYLVLEIFGVFTLDIPVSIPDLVIGVIAAALVGSVLQLFFFDLDYRSTEKLRFEDDEYYYYVTAVPKRKQERSVDEWTQ